MSFEILFFLLVTLNFCEGISKVNPVCKLPKDPGPCYAAEKKWYFNPKSGLCLRFIYGGCGGNGNRFDKKIDCKRMCGLPGSHKLDTVDPCKQPIEAGDCIGFFPRWGMNQETGQCEEFIFGGCGGNDNQFDTKEKCEAFCIRREPNGEAVDLPEGTD